MDGPGLGLYRFTTAPVDMAPYSFNKLDVTKRYTGLPVWWPKPWGQQALFKAQLNASVEGVTSDTREASFGIREVTSELNKHGDLAFQINRRPFQVLGAGYAPDIFLRWNGGRFATTAELALDIGLNTIRLEGKMEHPELYEIADRLGIMILPGWECCGKWEAWPYNEDVPVSNASKWTTADYAAANASLRHEAGMLQTHPSVLGFMVGSDVHPDDRAAAIYVDGLKESRWQTPVISSASDSGYPELLGPSGMKMEGPYDWVPPNYLWDTTPHSNSKRYGAAFGFGSELGAGVGTPELRSLRKFLREDEILDLLKHPNATLFHAGVGETFSMRTVYNGALRHRYGESTHSGIPDFLLKVQMMDYEATRAQLEAYSAKWNARRPATGTIYWMLNNAWPSLQWNLFDFYLRGAGAYFGAKTGSRLEHVAYDYMHRDVYLINHSLDRRGPRTIQFDIIDTNGSTISHGSISTYTEPNSSRLTDIRLWELAQVRQLVFLRLKLLDDNATLSRNVYWLTSDTDKLDWHKTEWYYTPVKKYSDFRALDHLPKANLTVSATRSDESQPRGEVTITLENQSLVPAVFIRLNLVAPPS